MWLNHCNFDVISTIFLGFLKLRTHISVFWCFWWISGISEFLFLGIGHKTKTRKSQKIFIFWFIALQCMWICVLTTFFNFLSIKTDINRNGLNLKYLEGLKAFKTQLTAARFEMWLNHCNFDVNWTIFLGFLKLRTHSSVFWDFWWVSVICEFLFRAQNENPETTKNRYFWVIKLKCMWICFMITILTFWVSKTNSINLERSETLKRQIPATWSAIRLNDFEFDAI